MASPSVTYNFVNGTVADGDQVDTNFQDLINAMTDGSKSFSIDALTVAGAAIFNGAVTLGNATSDDVVVTGYLASNLISKTTNTYALGSSTILYSALYATRILAGDGTAAAPAYSFNSADNGDNGMYLSGANEISFSTAGTQRMVIDASGRVGVGAAPGTSIFEIKQSADSISGGLLLVASGAGTNNGGMYVDSTSLYLREGGTNCVQCNGGEVYFMGGNVGIGATTVPNNFRVKASQTNTNYGIIWAMNTDTSDSSATCPGLQVSKGYNNTSNSNLLISFEINNTGDTVGAGSGQGAIAANGAQAATFVSYSDERLKENITPLPGQLNKILSLKPSEFDYKDGSGHQIGFIAQEVQEVYPDLVSEGANGMLMLGTLSKWEARLVSAIQEQHAIITAMSSKLDTALAEIEELKAR